MRTVGVPGDALLRLPLELRYAEDFRFRKLWLPAPFGLLAGLLAARGIPLREKLAARALHGDAAANRLPPRARHRGRRAAEAARPGRPHRPLPVARRCASRRSTRRSTQASANAFLAALRDTLDGRATSASDLLLPRVDLSRLFPEPAAEFVRKHGGEVRLRHHGRATWHELKKPIRRGHRRGRAAPAQDAAARAGADYTYQPIYTCYLQYPAGAQLPFPMLGLADGLVQWVFDRGALTGEKGLLAAVISAQGDHQQMTQDELAETCHRELAKAQLVCRKAALDAGHRRKARDHHLHARAEAPGS